jgi:hypothetical protein
MLGSAGVDHLIVVAVKLATEAGSPLKDAVLRSSSKVTWTLASHKRLTGAANA